MKTIISQRYHETYDEETLDNGLKVILWHKKGYEKSLFMMVTPFGAEDICQRDNHHKIITHPLGIAHFLEHKMFAMQGEDVMNRFTAMGANVNAFTSYRETAYYASTSADPKAPLTLLLDFVQELDIDEASVEKEKGIITSELHMYQEMSDQRLIMETYASLFQKHPLRYDIAGDDLSVNQTTLTQLHRCYRMNYHPSNMILICVSGHDSEELLHIIKENQARKQFDPPILSETVEIREPSKVARKEFSFTMDVSVPKVSVAYKMTGIMDPYERLRREWAIRFLLDAHFTSLNPQYQTWLDEKIISDYCGCDVEIGENYGLLMFYSETQKQEDFIALCDNCMKQILSEDLDASLLEQLKKRYYAQSIRSMNNFDDIAISFARHYFMGVDIFAALDMLEELNQSDISEAKAYIHANRRAVVRLLPIK